MTVMRDKCQKTPSADECIQIKAQMEDLLRKCQTMITPVSACGDVRSRYCFIWPRELFCYVSPGGGGGNGNGQVPTQPPSSITDPEWTQVYRLKSTRRVGKLEKKNKYFLLFSFRFHRILMN